MRGMGGHRSRGQALAVAAMAAGLVACAPAVATTTPLPTFPAGPGPGQVERAAPAGLPDSCEALLAPAIVEAVLGLPIGAVEVTARRGVPVPGAGRLDRWTCDYDATGPVLSFVVGHYTDRDAARRQHALNTAEREAGAAVTTPQEIGAARALQLEEPGQEVLMLVHDRFTLDLALTRGPWPTPPTPLLDDLARRVLAALSLAGPSRP